MGKLKTEDQKKIRLHSRTKISHVKTPPKERVFDNSKFKDLYVYEDESLWNEDINTGNNIWE